MLRRLGAGVGAAGLLAAASPAGDATVAERFRTVTRATPWQPVATVPLRFPAFHPQGMVRIGDHFFISSVEIHEQPRKYPTPVDGHDRDTGRGVDHLFKVTLDGRLVADLILGEGAAYHPGGIDRGGGTIWVPVSEYRPNSRAIVYRVDPATMRASEAFRWADHVGGVAYDRRGRALVGVSWGSRRIFRWPLGGLRPARTKAVRGTTRPNPAQYIDYQDCHGAGDRWMLCGGLAEYAQGPDRTAFALGGLELIDLKTGRPDWQAPVELRSPTGRAMTQNPFWVEPTASGLRAWFLPDDDAVATLFAYDIAAR